jgi:GntR family transcriptional regulator, carbon starvation induced regulator
MLEGQPSSVPTLSERAAAVVEEAILDGALLPGAKLRIGDLARTYRIGTTPLREGLSRLLAHGLVQAVGQRGFRVAQTSREDLEDILLVRTMVETEALRLAIARGDDGWESGIVAALHRLRKAQSSSVSGGAAAKFDDAAAKFDGIHKAFHTALIAACGSPRLLAFHSTLYDQTYRYRRLLLRGDTFRPAVVDKEHSELARLALERKSDEACEKLRTHLRLTFTQTFRKEAQGRRAAKPRRKRRGAPSA